MAVDRGSESTSGLPYRDVLRQRLLHHSTVSGSITMMAAPGLIDEYVELCDKTFEDIGRKFSDEELSQLRTVLEGQLAAAFEGSHRSQIAITYETAAGGLVNYHVKAVWQTVDGAYNNWVATREPPLFGTHPDARVTDLTKLATDPAACPVLDIGAGTGRNALALARLGHRVDAVEMTAKFADILRVEAQKEALDVRVIERDVFATIDDLRRDYGVIVLSEVATDFRTTEQLRGVFELATECLAGGGLLVFNAFLCRNGYVPTEGARQLGQQCYTQIFTVQELRDAVSGLPLQLISDDSVYEYEKTHLPPEAWPPTKWYADWVSGRDVFRVPREESPVELRWLVYQKSW